VRANAVPYYHFVGTCRMMVAERAAEFLTSGS
jgi:hypothetical protein